MSAPASNKEEARLYQALLKALEEFAQGTGNVVRVKIRPPHRRRDALRVDMVFNDPALVGGRVRS